MYNPKLCKQNVYVFVHIRALEILFQIRILKTGCFIQILLNHLSPSKSFTIELNRAYSQDRPELTIYLA